MEQFSHLPSHLHRQHVADRLCRLDLRGRRDVGVGVEREARAEVPEHAADRFDVHAVLERERGERVPIGYNCDNTDKSSNIKGLRIFKCSFSMIFGARKPSKRGCRILRGNICDSTFAATNGFWQHSSTHYQKPPHT